MHVLADVNNENTLCSHLYIFGPEFSFIFAAVRKEYVCIAPANEDIGRKTFTNLGQ